MFKTRYKEIIHNALPTANLKQSWEARFSLKIFGGSRRHAEPRVPTSLHPSRTDAERDPSPPHRGLMRGSTCVAFSLGVTAAWTNLDWSMWTGWWPRWQSQERGPGECMQDKEHSHTPCVFREPVWGRGRCTLGSHLDGSLGRGWSVKRPQQREAETSPNFQQPKK